MSKKLDRRSFLRRVGATAGIGALGIVTGTSVARAQVTDSDTGANADPVGRGRTGVTDSDTGSSADRAGHGRGSRSDPGGRGRNCSDSDGGSRADPGGRGRNCSDSD
ncbi:MAG: twin-arginine translocation signal domain-containing protein [Parasphingopyxis sp.]|uniref:twin-arginine translocation signal domain-containing protein n=1 Tax=Parasphingopyxis sp. TaxID=1920299 RepID=UPI003F9F7AF9